MVYFSGNYTRVIYFFIFGPGVENNNQHPFLFPENRDPLNIPALYSKFLVLLLSNKNTIIPKSWLGFRD